MGRSEDVARTLAVVSLTAGNLLLVAVNATAGLGMRTLFERGASAFWWVTGIAGAALCLAIALPGGRQLLRFGVPGQGDLTLSLTAVTFFVALSALLSRPR
jgi:Ca2+-transporting ATPase